MCRCGEVIENYAEEFSKRIPVVVELVLKSPVYDEIKARGYILPDH